MSFEGIISPSWELLYYSDRFNVWFTVEQQTGNEGREKKKKTMMLNFTPEKQ